MLVTLFIGGIAGAAGGLIVGLWGGFFLAESEYLRGEYVEVNPDQLELDLKGGY